MPALRIAAARAVSAKVSKLNAPDRRVFDGGTGVERVGLTHEDEVTAVVFSPDGAWVATASHDRTARVFVVGTEELRNAVVAHMSRPLTDAEWKRYGGRPSEL